MRAITRRLRKVQFYRETMTDLGRLLSHTETAGMPIVRACTPRPAPLASDSERVTAPMAFLVDETIEREFFR